jgi:hypothetical protein
MERDDAALREGPTLLSMTRVLPDDLVDRRFPIVAPRPLNIDRKMQ